ncbi:hypothetical protein F7725_000159, partial [Dissostichus mawsoni]
MAHVAYHHHDCLRWTRRKLAYFGFPASLESKRQFDSVAMQRVNKTNAEALTDADMSVTQLTSMTVPTSRRGCRTGGRQLKTSKSMASAWPDFKGTWDLPVRIPAQRINPTGRSVEGLSRLKVLGLRPRGHRPISATQRQQKHGQAGGCWRLDVVEQ